MRRQQSASLDLDASANAGGQLESGRAVLTCIEPVRRPVLGENWPIRKPIGLAEPGTIPASIASDTTDPAETADRGAAGFEDTLPCAPQLNPSLHAPTGTQAHHNTSGPGRRSETHEASPDSVRHRCLNISLALANSRCARVFGAREFSLRSGSRCASGRACGFRRRKTLSRRPRSTRAFRTSGDPGWPPLLLLLRTLSQDALLPCLVYQDALPFT